ncbi:thiamine pyrophosphate-dependent enzyme, partial [Streptomyces olivaceoviridis]
VNPASADPSPTTLSLMARHEKLIEAFGGRGYHVESPVELASALTEALESGRPALIDCHIDPTAGTESGHLTNLNPSVAVRPSGTGK